MVHVIHPRWQRVRQDPLPLLYDLLAALLLAWGTVHGVQAASHLGQVYGGFLWIYDPTFDPPYYVGFFPWRTIRSDPHRLHSVDHPLSVQGQPAAAYPQVYVSLAPGAAVTYEVERQGERLTLVEPARRFGLSDFLAAFGLFYILLVTCLWSGRVLMRGGQGPHRRLLAWLTLAAGSAVMHFIWDQNSFNGPPSGSIFWFRLISKPVPSIGGALVLHSLLLRPHPWPFLQRHPRTALGLYLPPLLTAIIDQGLFLFWPAEEIVAHKGLFDALIYAHMAYGGLCLAVGVGRVGLWLPRMRRGWAPTDRQAALALLVIAGYLLVVLVGFWWIPAILTGFPLLPFEVLLAMGCIFPVGMVYALRNGDLLHAAEERAREAEALRRTREQMLHHIADQIHERFLPDLQGVRMLVASVHVEDEQARQDLQQAVGALQGLVDAVRALLDTTKPVDWSRQPLGEMLAWLAQRMARLYPETQVRAEVAGYDEADPPRVKEAIHHVAVAALNNALIHGQAGRVILRLQSDRDAVELTVEDDGVGFEPVQVAALAQDRRHMGLELMRFHAQEVNGTLEVTSQPGQGTRIRLHAPRPG